MKTKKNQDPQSAILCTGLEGRATLETYKDKSIGVIVAFRGKREIFWVSFQALEDLMEEFKKTIKLKGTKI